MINDVGLAGVPIGTEWSVGRLSRTTSLIWSSIGRYCPAEADLLLHDLGHQTIPVQLHDHLARLGTPRSIGTETAGFFVATGSALHI